MFLPLNATRSQGFQIVATLGPASLRQAAALAAAGATSFRFNASHMSPLELREALELVREQLPEAPLLVDLQGAKMRLGQFLEQRLRAGELVRFSPEAQPKDGFSLPHPELFEAASKGDRLTADDGKLSFRVVEARPDLIEALVLEDGPLKPRKGINLEDHPVRLRDLLDRDSDACELGTRIAGAAFAFSFMCDGSETQWLRRRSPGAAVIGKVERREATERLAEIDAAVDAIWICRGDLGEQLGPAGLARFVNGLDPTRLRKPVLMAGQVLEHLTAHATATRSEICHLYDLVARGYAGIVLSDETAIGEDPVRAVRTAAQLIAGFAR